jgi:type VI protein secretion system component VasF
MNVPHDDARWVDRATALLDASADNLDAATLSRLNRARQAALAARPGRWRPWTIGAGLAGTAAAMLAIAIGLSSRIDAPMTHAAAPLDASDIDVLASDDDTLDLSENLDFYAWLETQPADVHGG